ncbi:probable carboxylesterase 12 [Camellia sinensis]|uniref:probable carboxylesterase 12 n=1 Tax=Camellia sinensis TaxID=4442 RepID=UPI001036D46C|nr:probable carboxylesterase 12 [Camellia sinensis]
MAYVLGFTSPSLPILIKKLPLVVYGGFGLHNAFFPPHDTYVYSLVKKANVVALSVDYRQGPKNPLSIPYDDSWEAIKDSAGANIAYNMVMRAGSEKLDGLNVNGIALIHPYFWGNKPIGTHESRDATSRLERDNIWLINSQNAFGLDDPRLNPLVDPKLSSLGCSKVLVLIAEKDIYRDRGFYYYEALRTKGWKGNVEIMETPGTHVFQLNFPDSKYAQEMLERISSFVKKP